MTGGGLIIGGISPDPESCKSGRNIIKDITAFYSHLDVIWMFFQLVLKPISSTNSLFIHQHAVWCYKAKKKKKGSSKFASARDAWENICRTTFPLVCVCEVFVSCRKFCETHRRRRQQLSSKNNDLMATDDDDKEIPFQIYE